VARSPYPDVFSRLVANTHEPANSQACWVWAGKRCRTGYGRLNLHVPGLAKTVTLSAHVATYAAMHGRPASPDELWLMYQELVASGLELDHLCSMRPCIYPDHLELVTPAENCRRRDARAASKCW
jgi:hypothetical protein